MNSVRHRLSCKIAVVALAGLIWVVGSANLRATGEPLTKDDVTLLLLGGSSSAKMVELIKERGISFTMTAELAGEFRREGADDAVIQALEAKPSPASKAAASPSAGAASQTAPAKPASGSQAANPSPSPAASSAGPTPSARNSASESGADGAPSVGPPAESPARTAPSPSPAAASAPATAARSTAPSSESSSSSTPSLGDPSPERIQQIIEAFAAKETLFRQARDNYTYHQINKVEELGPDNQIEGQYQQDWDILYDDNGSRIERVTYAPLDTLKGLQITEQDLDAFRNIQPFVLTSDELPEYDIQYRGHVKVDELTAYVFSIRPKAIQKGKQYFQGMVWVDDRDLQIVKSEGKNVPEMRKKGGEENLFPRFTTWREQIDGKFWFPTFTLADDNLYFTSGPIHIREIVKYTDYKQFRSTVRIKNVAVGPNQPNSEGGQPPQDQTSPPKK